MEWRAKLLPCPCFTRKGPHIGHYMDWYRSWPSILQIGGSDASIAVSTYDWWVGTVYRQNDWINSGLNRLFQYSPFWQGPLNGLRLTRYFNLYSAMYSAMGCKEGTRYLWAFWWPSTFLLSKNFCQLLIKSATKEQTMFSTKLGCLAS